MSDEDVESMALLARASHPLVRLDAAGRRERIEGRRVAGVVSRFVARCGGFVEAFRALRHAPLRLAVDAFALLVIDAGAEVLVERVSSPAALANEARLAVTPPFGAISAHLGGGPLWWVVALLATIYLARTALRSGMRVGYLRLQGDAVTARGVVVAHRPAPLRAYASLAFVLAATDLLPCAAAGLVALPAAALAFVGFRLQLPALAMCGVFTALALGVGAYGYLWLGAYFADFVVVLDDASADAALRRAWQLARGRRLRIFVRIASAASAQLLGFCSAAIAPVGLLVTWPPARAYADALLMNLYRDLAQEARA